MKRSTGMGTHDGPPEAQGPRRSLAMKRFIGMGTHDGPPEVQGPRRSLATKRFTGMGITRVARARRSIGMSSHIGKPSTPGTNLAVSASAAIFCSLIFCACRRSSRGIELDTAPRKPVRSTDPAREQRSTFVRTDNATRSKLPLEAPISGARQRESLPDRDRGDV